VTWRERVEARLEEVRSAGRWREVRTLDGRGPRFRLGGREVVSFASNDYLGLAAHERVRAAGNEAAERWGSGAGASRLVVGGRPVHDELEAALAEWKGAERALLFPTGYTANIGVLATFGDWPDVLIVSDELNHASIIDGARLARAQVAVARHADPGHVDELLAAHDGPAVVVTDVVFSMDGHLAPVPALHEVCERRGALLVLDEAHVVFGLEVDADADVLRVGTLSKALGSLGGFVAGPARYVELLVNAARAFIFTTAPTPAASASALTALGILRSPEGAALLARLRRHVDRVGGADHPSAIVPVILGAESAATQASARLLESGLLVPAIRPPTVPVGASRLRVALSAAHDDGDVERLVAALGELRP